MDVDEADKQNANPKHVDDFVLDENGLYHDKRGHKYSKNKNTTRKGTARMTSTARLAHLHTRSGLGGSTLPLRAIRPEANLNT